ncbi:MAG: single-stranded-DNA-specific exonuclease RecJ [Bacteroidetes bacterium]|nr:single-stranded-DNA-specific exonuclease RecJ [Bacteroidota bacterium]
MEYRWSAKPQPPADKVALLTETLNINPKLASILVQRDITHPDEAIRFFEPKMEHLHDPFLMKDMDKAISRIEQAIKDKEGILIYGDYDVDGTTAVAIVYQFFRSFNPRMDYYIPDRYKEGYGISRQGIAFAKENGYSLIIALDCGVRSNVLVEEAKALGIDFIICDHHLPGATIPEAVAVLDPKRSDCTYPYKELSGCGIGFKLIQAYIQKSGMDPSRLDEYLDLVAVSIASDIVDIRGENRVLAYFGLKKLNNDPCIGLQSLLHNYVMKEEYTITDIVFGLGPRINAAGRIADARAAVKVLIEKDFNTSMQLAKVLNERNVERKDLDSDITREAVEMIQQSEELLRKRSTVLFGEHWHKGVIGIVASRLVEQFYKPTIVFSRTENMLTGSARSVKDFDIHEAIGKCGDLVEQFGGHKYAAGLSIKSENLEAFCERFEAIVHEDISERSLVPEIEYDVELSLADITKDFYHSIQKLAPFGPGNMLPVFKTENLCAQGNARILKEKHLKIQVYQDGQLMDGIGFGLAEVYPYVSGNNRFHATYCIEENTFNNRTTLQLRLKDIKTAELMQGLAS